MAGGVLLPNGPDDPPGPNLPPPASPVSGSGFGLDLAFVLLVWVVSAALGSVLFAVALRRRTEQSERSTFAFAIAMAGSGLPPPPEEARDAEVDQPAAAPDPESSIPRWRRPSLQAARQSSYAEPGANRMPLRFDAGFVVGALRIVGYRLVLVSDRPTDNAAVELGRLDRGDQVDLLRLENGYALVKAPDGLRGWVEASTLELPADD